MPVTAQDIVAPRPKPAEILVDAGFSIFRVVEEREALPVEPADAAQNGEGIGPQPAALFRPQLLHPAGHQIAGRLRKAAPLDAVHRPESAAVPTGFGADTQIGRAHVRTQGT